ncbi:MAG: UDP-N-acetylmuramoyl-L-alanine--D-glutamate ligase [Rhodospirillales bacterium]|nr:UDP-N-acetylmuramoyl-L-alanine--D-glutamate ligase [Rhodospirillales bacterium]
MIDLSFLSGAHTAVLGLGRSGMAVARALVRGGAMVAAWDDNSGRRAEAQSAGIPLVDLHARTWQEGDILVLSPGIPHTYPAPHPVAAAARAAGCAIIGDVELLARAAPDARYVGITGTNGKSTTTALLGHILQSVGEAIQVGGNLGPAVADFRVMGAEGVYVLEMSSYQLELADSLAFDVAVLLNITPDHLDRHGGMDGYIAAKRRIFNCGRKDQTAIVGIDDDLCRAMRDELVRDGKRRVVPVSARGAVAGGVYADGTRLIDDTDGEKVDVIDLGGVMALRGRHNIQNTAAAYAAARALGIAPQAIVSAITGFPGLVHRQQVVGIIDGVTYVNDSKATNADASARALSSFDNIYWIAGGRPKEGGIDDLVGSLSSVRHAFLIGEAAEAFAQTLKDRVPTTLCGDLKTAVGRASRAALDGGAGGVVLLSPACASFDQFTDFEARGDAFCAFVDAIPGERSEGVAA